MDSEKKSNFYEHKRIVNGKEVTVYSKMKLDRPPKKKPMEFGFMMLNFNKKKDGRE